MRITPQMVTPSEPSTLVTFNVGLQPREIAVADFNGDGLSDVVSANAGDGSLTILLGTGDAQLLASPTSIPAGQEPADVDTVDVDRDGDVDLVVANHETSNVTVLLNDGHTHFEQADYSPLNTGARPHVHGLATSDFNGDGWPDIAVDSADARVIPVLHGALHGYGEAMPVAMTTMPYFRIGASDLSGDGIAELLVPGQSDQTVRIIQYQSDSYMPYRTITLKTKPWMVIGDDVNGDGQNDVIVVETDAVSIWLASPEGFSEASGSPYQIIGATEVATGDINGDHVPDVIVGPWDGDEVVIIWGGDFTTSRTTVCERPVGLAAADLDGNKKDEILATCTTRHALAVQYPPQGP